MQRVSIRTAFVAAVLLPSINVAAQTHVVSSGELHDAVLSASQQREQNRDKLKKILSTPAAEKIMHSRGAEPEQVRQSISLLSDEELNQLAARANTDQPDFAAGGPGLSITVAVIAIVLTILILYFATSALRSL